MIKNISIHFTEDSVPISIKVNDPLLNESIISYIISQRRREQNAYKNHYNNTLLCPDYIKEIYDYLKTDYKSDITLNTLEEKFKKSKFKICKDFNKAYDISPIKFLNRVRIQNAKDLLLSTDNKIHEIGEIVGIDNTNHFINLFKTITGMTPLQFRHSFIK
ncbi:MAG: helix-turn-helix transcriptional regulator [Lachnospiraceae bacterium]|nr:helix-turn-helix transcriptional regulator [Lachnospiraceae bacterium]